MSNLKETPEPWEIHYDPHTEQGRWIIQTVEKSGASGIYHRETAETHIEENARRIVACVNACAEVEEKDLPSLKRDALLGRVLTDAINDPDGRIATLERQRDELLAALKECADFIDDCGAQAGVATLLDGKIYPLIKRIEGVL